MLDAEKIDFSKNMNLVAKFNAASKHVLLMLNVCADIKTILDSVESPSQDDVKKAMDLYSAMQSLRDVWTKVVDPAPHIEEVLRRFQEKYSVQSLATPLLQQELASLKTILADVVKPVVNAAEAQLPWNATESIRRTVLKLAMWSTTPAQLKKGHGDCRSPANTRQARQDGD